MRLSLRATISLLSAIAVAIVAATTLGIALPSSFNALRTTGKDLALALIRVANTQTLSLFEEPLRIQEATQQWALREHWDWPSDNETVYTLYVETQLALQSHAKFGMAGSVTAFADSTRITTFPLDNTITAMLNHITTPVSEDGFLNRIKAVDHRYYYTSNGSRVPDTHYATREVYPDPEVLYNTSVWDLALAGTAFGRATTISSLLVAEIAGEPQAYVPVISPLYRKGGPQDPSNLFGVVGTSMYAAQISQFLRDIKGTVNTEAYAIDGLGYLVGSSEAPGRPFNVITRNVSRSAPVGEGCSSSAALDGLYGPPSPGGAIIICRAHIRDYGVAALEQVSQDPSFAFVDGDAVRLVDVDGEQFYIASSRVPLRYSGLELNLIATMPEADVIGNIVRSRNVAIGVTVVVVLLVGGAIFLAITLLLSPLATVAERMERAASFEDTGEEEVVSVMAEVADLQAAYYAMNTELLRIRGFVPQAVLLRHNDLDDDETDTDALGLSTHDTEATREGSTIRMHPRLATSQESVRTSGSRRSTRSAAKRGAALVNSSLTGATTPLRTATVTVLAANLCGFSREAQRSRADDVTAAIAALAEIVDSTIHSFGGVLAHFHGDHFVATFNAAQSCSAHAQKAALAAHSLATSAATVGLHLPLRCGLATSRCSVGYAGSTNLKAFSTIGPAFSHSQALERLCKLHGVATLASRRTCADLTGSLGYVFTDIVALPTRDGNHRDVLKRLSLVATLLEQADDPARVMAPGGDEWLYVINHNGGRGTVGDHNLRFEAMYSCFAAAAARRDAPTADAQLTSLHHPGDAPPTLELAAPAAATADELIPTAAVRRLEELERCAKGDGIGETSDGTARTALWAEGLRNAVSLGRYYDAAIAV